MKNTHQKPSQVKGLWIDQYLMQQQQDSKRNTAQFHNSGEKQTVDQKRQTSLRNFSLEIPFVKRFEGKLFTFNKLGIMQKLQMLDQNSNKTGLVFRKLKLSGNSCVKSIFRNRKDFVKINKIKLSSRESVSTKDALKEIHKQTKSLDASKVSSSGSGSNRYKYDCNYTEIKEEQFQETIIKNSTKLKRVNPSLRFKNNKENVRKQLQYQTLINRSEVITNIKPSIKRFFNDDDSKEKSQTVPLTPNYTSLNHSRNVEIKLKQLPQFPKLKLAPQQQKTLKKQQIKNSEQNYIGQIRALPKVHFSRSKKTPEIKNYRLLTIR